MKLEGKILLIDDDQLNSKTLVARLSKRGLDISYLSDPMEAEESLEKQLPDLVLLDIVMTGISGLDLLEKIRKKHKIYELPIIMLSSKTEDRDIVSALKIGANDYLTKPINLDVALARISTQLILVKLNKENVEKKEIETINSMIVTYNHEIINPLTIIKISIDNEMLNINEFEYEKIYKSIKRIEGIISKIQLLEMGKIEKEEYLKGGSHLIKIK